MIEVTANLTNQFLIAMPGLEDPFFSKTVTYLCQHNEEGALGIIINRPSDLTVGDVLEQMGITSSKDEFAKMPVYFGGPVQPERGFVLHEAGREWNSTLKISQTLALTTSRDILEALSLGEGPSHMLLALGYAGWGKGQLEAEIGQNSWLNTEAEQSIIFNRPAALRWRAAAEQLGIDIGLLTMQPGHG